MPVFHTKTIEGILEPVAQQVTVNLLLSTKLFKFEFSSISVSYIFISVVVVVNTPATLTFLSKFQIVQLFRKNAVNDFIRGSI